MILHVHVRGVPEALGDVDWLKIMPEFEYQPNSLDENVPIREGWGKEAKYFDRIVTNLHLVPG